MSLVSRSIEAVRRALPLAGIALSLAGAAALSGCGRPVDVKTAPGFVEVDTAGRYAYRATTPEGIVLGVRVEADHGGDLGFWTKAVTLKVRDVSGYALQESRDVASRDGTKGKELRFAHDENGKPYAYWVSLFVAQDRLFIVEAGGAEDAMARHASSVDWMQKSVKVRCDSLVAPVLASRTCGEW